MEMGRSNTGVTGDSVADGVDLMVSDKSLYVEGEKVWASHKGKWYPAKVQKVESRMNTWTYFVHYLAVWLTVFASYKRQKYLLRYLRARATFIELIIELSLYQFKVIQQRLPALWDEWLELENLMKFTEEDIQKQSVQCGRPAMVKNINHGQKNKKNKSAAARGKKGKRESNFKEKCLMTEENMLDIEMPPILKKQLLDDCEFVTHLGKLVKLPRTPNVDDILKKYFAVRVKNNNKSSEAIQEILTGLRCYFDKALPAMLLYKNERRQYEEACAENILPSTVYGSEHLLRLFVKLPEILYDAKIDEETLLNLQPKILDLLKFLQKNQSTFFLSSYQTPEDLDTNIKTDDEA